ncbi:MAG: phospholipid carrier-dependent glycosyltransferase [Spirulina sp.]
MIPKTASRISLWLGLIGLSILALGLRLWGLGRFNQLVFDEVYYIPFALGYLNQSPQFDAHPPLGKYLIALGLWLGQWGAAWFHWPPLMVEGQTISLLSGRLINALVGATLPALVAALAYGLSRGYAHPRRIRFGLVAAALMVLEGLTLVESRLALINLYWLWFGLLGQVFWVMAPLRAHPYRWRIAAGIALGAAINVKWNGAAFWLGLLLWEVVRPQFCLLTAGVGGRGNRAPTRWWVGKRRWWLYLGLIPLMTYGLLWWTHLAMTGETFWGIHQQLWQVHQTIGAGGASHPYCSPWFTWPLMLRPVAYLYQILTDAPGKVVAIQAMGNPMLWWLSTAAMLVLGLSWFSGRRQWWIMAQPKPQMSLESSLESTAHADSGDSSSGDASFGGTTRESSFAVESFLVLNYLAQWLPWLLVSRCTFLYHALGMVAFSALALAWLMSGWLGHRRRSHRVMAWAMLGLIVLGFLFWLPLFVGWPISPDALQRRWWLPTWI